MEKYTIQNTSGFLTTSLTGAWNVDQKNNISRYYDDFLSTKFPTLDKKEHFYFSYNNPHRNKKKKNIG